MQDYTFNLTAPNAELIIALGILGFLLWLIAEWRDL